MGATWVTPEQPFERKITAAHSTISTNSFIGIGRAGGVIATTTGNKGTESVTIESNQGQQHLSAGMRGGFFGCRLLVCHWKDALI